MTDDVKRLCGRWLWMSAIGALAGFLLAYALAGSSSLSIAALPIVTVALAQVVALSRYQPAPGMALVWLLATPIFMLVAYVLGLVGFSGWRHAPSYREYAAVIGAVTTPFVLILGWIQGAILKRWIGHAPFWALITAIGNIVALIAVLLLAWLLETSGFMKPSDHDGLMAGAFAPLMFVLSAFQMISLKNLAMPPEPVQRAA
jgi:hypothetical protein